MTAKKRRPGHAGVDADTALSQRSTPVRIAPGDKGPTHAGNVVWAKYEGSFWPAKVTSLSSRRSVGSSVSTVPVRLYELNKTTTVSLEDIESFYDPSDSPIEARCGARLLPKRETLHVASGAFKRAVALALAEHAGTQVAERDSESGIGVKRPLDVDGEKKGKTVEDKSSSRKGRTPEARSNTTPKKSNESVSGRRAAKKLKVAKSDEEFVDSLAASGDVKTEEDVAVQAVEEVEEDVEEEAMTEYEKKRIENMKRNQDILVSLSLPVLPNPPSSARTPTVRARGLQPNKRQEATPTRQRSLRIQGLGSDGKALPPSFKEPLSSKSLEGRGMEEDRVRREGDLSLSECCSARHRRTGADEQADALREAERAAASELAATLSRLAAPTAMATEGGATSTLAEYQAGLKAMAVQEQDIAKVVPQRVTALAVHPSREQLVVAAGDKAGWIGFFLPDAATDDSCVTLMDVHSRAVVSLVFNPLDPRQLFSASYDNHVRALDVDSQQWRVVLDAEDRHSFMSSCAFDADRHVLYCGYGSGEVSLLDPRAGKKAQFKSLHGKTVRGVQTCPADANLLLTASIDTTAKLWDVRKLKPSQAVATIEHGKGVCSAKFNRRGTLAVTTSYDNTLRVLDMASKEQKLKIEHNNETGRWLSSFQAVFDPRRDDAIVIGSMLQPRGVDVISAGSGKKLARLQCDNFGMVTSLNVWHPSLPFLAGANSSGKVYIWR